MPLGAWMGRGWGGGGGGGQGLRKWSVRVQEFKDERVGPRDGEISKR